MAYTGVSHECEIQYAFIFRGSKSPEPAVKEGLSGTAYFDWRLFTVPTLEEALNCILWRCRHDAVRNGVGAFARTMFSTEELHGKSTQEVSEMMNEKGVVFRDAVPAWAVEGTLEKKEQFEHEGRNEKTGVMEITVRSRTRAADRGIAEFSEENLKLVREKYWNGCKGEEV